MLQELFPSWQPTPTSVEICAVCEALAHMSKEDKREIRKQVEEEKVGSFLCRPCYVIDADCDQAKLKHMYENALNGNTALLEAVPCAVVPAQFIRAWKAWIMRPGDVSRPDCIDNSQLICEHGHLVLDPNSPSDLDMSSVAIIKRTDWDILESL